MPHGPSLYTFERGWAQLSLSTLDFKRRELAGFDCSTPPLRSNNLCTCLYSFFNIWICKTSIIISNCIRYQILEMPSTHCNKKKRPRDSLKALKLREKTVRYSKGSLTLWEGGRGGGGACLDLRVNILSTISQFLDTPAGSRICFLVMDFIHRTALRLHLNILSINNVRFHKSCKSCTYFIFVCSIVLGNSIINTLYKRTLNTSQNQFCKERRDSMVSCL